MEHSFPNRRASNIVRAFESTRAVGPVATTKNAAHRAGNPTEALGSGGGAGARSHRSENILQPKLNEPWGDRCGTDLPKARAAEGRTRVGKLRVVEGVEEFRAKLQRCIFV